MQPRLVAISYPPSLNDGEGGERVKRLSRFRRAKSEAETYSDLHARLARKLRRFSWHDFKSQISFPRRKRISINEATGRETPQPWSQYYLNGSGFVIDRGHAAPKKLSKWESLPSEVQTNIIKHVEATYSRELNADAGYQRRKSVMALQLSCKAWLSVAQRHLYETIQLKPSYDYDWSTTPPKVRHTRLLELRKILRSSPYLADLVKHLTLLPGSQDPEQHQIVYSDLVASIVMACPNLETLTSLHVPYIHNFNRLHHALSTRTRLTKHTWIIGDDHFTRSRAGKRYSAGILSSQQTRLFLHHHSLWKNLEELNIISHQGRGILEHGLFIRTVKSLPLLKRLHVSSFDANDFSDETLLALPQLTSLRLDRCSGITESGLCKWAESPQAANIERLVLESQNITSLLTVAALLSVLPKLETFRMVQLEFEPSLPLELEVKQPLLSSLSLKTLEWFVACGWDPDTHKYHETASPENLHTQLQAWSHSKVTQHILSSILDYGFPSLRKILLPGYGNLSGLLRWVRHTAPVNQQQDVSSDLQRRHTVKNPPHSAPIVRLRRDGSRLSLRPSSPTFTEYSHWQKEPLFNRPEVSNSEIPECPSPLDEHESISSSRSVSPLSMAPSDNLPTNHLDEDTYSLSSSSLPSSLSSRQSSLSQSPKPSDLSRSSTLKVTRSPSADQIEHVTKKFVNFKLPLDDSASDITPTPKFSLPSEFDQLDCVPGWKKQKEGATAAMNDQRHSGISILLGGYVYTA